LAAGGSSSTRSVSAVKANVPGDVNKTNIKFGRNKEIVLKEIMVVDWNRELKKTRTNVGIDYFLK
jgi:hypothetical protein